MKKKWITSSGLALLLLSAALTGCNVQEEQPSANEQAEAETPVQVSTIQRGTLNLQNEIIGTATPTTAVDIYPKMSGDLISVHVEKGDFVSKGAVLANIESDDLKDQLDLAISQLEIAQSDYKNLRRSGTYTDTELTSAENMVSQAQIQVNQAQRAFDNAKVTTPISGQVVNVSSEVGEYVTATAPLFSVVSMDPITVNANLSGNQMLLLQDKEEIEVEVLDLGKTYSAKISYLSPVTDDTGFYTLEAKIDNSDGEIKSGMITKFLVDQELVKDALLVPTESIVEKNGVSTVFIVEDGYAVQKEVQVLESQSELSAVEGDLAENDIIVTRGQITLSDGNKVQIIEGAQ